ncbi:MAG: ABC transporter permease [Candidatus Aminicenantes bacterium]|nr:ABC transporter permease [Candidatus Aminicenantes bacterium]
MIAKLAIKNIWRNKRRTLITLAVITIGVSMLCLAMAYIEYVKWGYGEGIIHGNTGHFQVLRRDLLHNEEEKILSFGLLDWKALTADVKKDPRVRVATPRINFFGLCSTGDKSAAVMAQAVLPEGEIAMGEDFIDATPLRRLLAEPEGILLGELLAKSLNVREGGEVTLLTTTAGGAMNGCDFKVIGTIRTGFEEMDKRFARLSLPTAQALLASPKVERLVVTLRDTRELPAALAVCRSRLPEGIVAQDWLAVYPDFGKTMNFFNGMIGFVLPVLMLIVWFSTMNTILMSLMERSTEFATLRAMGTSKGRLFRMLVGEGAWIGLLGVALGIVIEIGLVFLINRADIMMPPPPGSTEGYRLGLLNSTEIFTFVGPVTLMVVILSTFIPARRIFGLNIVRALRNG